MNFDDLEKVRRGTLFHWNGLPELAVYVEHKPGHGAGMGDFPPIVRVICRSGLVLQAEPWSAPHKQVIAKFPRLTEATP